MRKQKIIMAFLLAAVLLVGSLPMTAIAAEAYGYEVGIAPSPVAIGSEVTLTFRLTDYTDSKSGIRGFQIDLTDVDDVLHNAVCTTLVKDTENCLTNTAKYQSSRDIVRHAYTKMSGTMDYSVDELLEVKFVIPDSYAEAGTLSLPLRILIQNAAGDKLTYNDTVEIRYVPASEIPDGPDQEIVNVDVTWGAMEFVYTDGVWNTEKHIYEGAGWTDNGTGYVTVKNSGTVETSARFFYITDRTDISGVFNVETVPVLEAGGEVTARLTLNGKPEKALSEKTVIGSVTVQIGGE